MGSFEIPPAEQGVTRDYPGEWVAVRFGVVRAHHVSELALVHLVRDLPRRIQDDIVVFRVPVPGEPTFLGWVSL